MEMQAIIDDKGFSLLISKDGMQNEEEFASKSSIQELTLTDVGKKAGNALNDISTLATKLEPEEEMKFI